MGQKKDINAVGIIGVVFFLKNTSMLLDVNVMQTSAFILADTIPLLGHPCWSYGCGRTLFQFAFEG